MQQPIPSNSTLTGLVPVTHAVPSPLAAPPKHADFLCCGQRIRPDVDGRDKPGQGGEWDGASLEHGFTLIEILVVLAIMGMTLAIFLTQGTNHHPATDLRAAANGIASGLRLARSQAIATDRPTAFVIDLADHAWRIGDAPPRPFAAELALTVTTIAGAAGNRAAAIGFAPDGSSTGGRIDLAAGQRLATVDVDWLTGRVSVIDGR